MSNEAEGLRVTAMQWNKHPGEASPHPLCANVRAHTMAQGLTAGTAQQDRGPKVSPSGFWVGEESEGGRLSARGLDREVTLGQGALTSTCWVPSQEPSLRRETVTCQKTVDANV